MRVLGRIRLSRATDESTSVERQREDIERWSSGNGHEIVGWAEDLDVSGSVDPFDTPALGPWLTERHPEWDIICSWKLDRISRRAIPMGKLFGWLQEHDKTLVCTGDSIDLSNPMGRLIAYVIATIAEGELEAIRERNRASAQKLREMGRWAGGKPIYGYLARQRRDASGWELVADPHASAVLLKIIERVLAGESLTAIAESLNRAGEPSPNDYIRKRSGKKPQGNLWQANNLGRILRSQSLLGNSTHNGALVRDDEGLPIQLGKPLVSRELFDQLQQVLDDRSVLSSTRTRKTSPLLGVAVCATCGSNLYHRKVTGEKYRYYLCGTCRGPQMRADDLETLLEETFLLERGDRKVQRRVFIQAENHQIELEDAVRAVDEISTLMGTMTSETVRSRLLMQLSALDSRIKELEALPSREARWEMVEDGKTNREVWAEADTEARRQLLLKSGITLSVSYIDKNLVGALKVP